MGRGDRETNFREVSREIRVYLINIIGLSTESHQTITIITTAATSAAAIEYSMPSSSLRLALPFLGRIRLTEARVRSHVVRGGKEVYVARSSSVSSSSVPSSTIDKQEGG